MFFKDESLMLSGYFVDVKEDGFSRKGQYKNDKKLKIITKKK